MSFATKTKNLKKYVLLLSAVVLLALFLLPEPIFFDPGKTSQVESLPLAANDPETITKPAPMSESEVTAAHKAPRETVWKTARVSHSEKLNDILHEMLHYLRGSMLARHGKLFPYPTLPKIAFVSQKEMAAHVCGGKCLIRGWFPQGDTIYLDNSLKVVKNLENRSIMLHELVHYYQPFVYGEAIKNNDCETARKLEAEAYEIQYQWMDKHHVGQRMPPYNYLIQKMKPVSCGRNVGDFSHIKSDTESDKALPKR